MKVIFFFGVVLTVVTFSLPADAQFRYRQQGYWGLNFTSAPFYRDSTDPDSFIRGQIRRDIPLRNRPPS